MAPDHAPIIVTISTHLISRQQPPNVHNSKTNQEPFGNQIEEYLRLNMAVKTAEDIEQAVKDFGNVILLGASQTDGKPQRPSQRKKIRRRWQMSRHPKSNCRYNESTRKLKAK
jgi:hypothetical protein